MANLWEHEEPIRETFPGIDVPDWIDQTISPSDVVAIVQGGCASGAYMPAVTYATALETMSKHGDDVLDFIEESGLSWRDCLNDSESWSGIACALLSTAAELWAGCIESELEKALEEEE